MPDPSLPPADAPAPAGFQASALARYTAAFESWVRRRQDQGVFRQASSVAVYRSMWTAFTHWGIGEGLGLQQLSAADLERFLSQRAGDEGLTDRHAWRWLMLLDAVLRQGEAGDLIRGLPALAPNRAAASLLESRPEWRYANAGDRDPLPDHLDAAQARRLVDWLLDDHSGYSAPGARAGSWQALRNRASVALQLGAGLAPGDVRAVLALGVMRQGGRLDRPHRVRIPRHGAIAERDAPIAPWAARLLQQWLERRTAEALPGLMLFPGTRKGLAWSKVSQFEAAAGVLQAAGLSEAGRGSFVLRHTFALRQLRRGHPAADVARWLGVTDPAVMARYQRVVYDAVDLA